MGIRELEGRGLVSGRCRGSALVSVKPISFLGGVDPETGLITERGHDLKGERLKGRVLCFPHGHGSTVGSYVLYSLVKKGVGPKAIVNESADPVDAAGAIIADVPMVDQVDIRRIKTGASWTVFGVTGVFHASVSLQ